MKPNLRLMSIIIGLIGFTILIFGASLDLIHDYYLLTTQQDTFKFPIWVYLIVSALFFISAILFLKHNRQTKQTPS